MLGACRADVFAGNRIDGMILGKGVGKGEAIHTQSRKVGVSVLSIMQL